MKRNAPNRHIELFFDLLLNGWIFIPVAEGKSSMDLLPFCLEEFIECFFVVNANRVLITETGRGFQQIGLNTLKYRNNAACDFIVSKEGPFTMRFVATEQI